MPPKFHFYFSVLLERKIQRLPGVEPTRVRQLHVIKAESVEIAERAMSFEVMEKFDGTWTTNAISISEREYFSIKNRFQEEMALVS